MTTSASPAAQRRLDALWSAQPESVPLLRLLAATIEAGADPAWDAAAGAAILPAEGEPGRPLLAGATVPVDRGRLDDLLRSLLRLAAETAPNAAPLAAAAAAPALDGPEPVRAAIDGDADAIAAAAAALDADAAILETVAGLAAAPLLQACRRRFASLVPADWQGGQCPVCGAWASLAERRGLERERRLRCARCGADWRLVALRCAFCGEADHAQLGTLLPEDGGEARQVETCDTCRGYLKSIATLRAWAGDEVALADLASIELDLAALERDFRRPDRIEAAASVRLVASREGRP